MSGPAKTYALRMDQIAAALTPAQRKAVCGLIAEAFERFEKLQDARAQMAAAKAALQEAEGYFFMATSPFTAASVRDDD
jgi:hypothetical protein